MNARERQTKINQCLNLVDKAYSLKKNTVRLNTHNTLRHELAKTVKCYELISDGSEVYTEVIFKNGARADVLIPERMQVIEILHSETEEEVLKKKDYYPESLDIIYFKSSEVLENVH